MFSEFVTYYLKLTDYFSLGFDTNTSLDQRRINEVKEIRTSSIEEEIEIDIDF